MADERKDQPRDGEDEQAQRKDIGAEGGEGGNKDTPPGAPGDDDSPLGDTDQHSSADA